MSISSIPVRSNGSRIEASWFNTIRSELLSAGVGAAYVSKDADYTATSDDGSIGLDASSNTVTISLPTAVGNSGRVFAFIAEDISFAAVVDADGSETINGSANYTFVDQYESIIVVSDGTEWKIKSSYNLNVVDKTSNESIAGVKTFTNTTDSSSKDTGAIVVEGGIGIEKNINAGGVIKAVGNLQTDASSVYKHITTPANPSSGFIKLYPKSDDKFYSLTSGGTETEIGSGGAAISVKVAHITDEKTSGTGGGTSASATTQIRTLNTMNDPSSIVTSLSSNQFTLPSGTYAIKAKVPGFRTNFSQAYLQDTTNSNFYYGRSAYSSGTADYCDCTSFVEEVITIASSAVFQIGQYTGNSQATSGLGVPSSSGNHETYTQVEISKIG